MQELTKRLSKLYGEWEQHQHDLAYMQQLDVASETDDVTEEHIRKQLLLLAGSLAILQREIERLQTYLTGNWG